jgi:hypothetical protein
VKKESGYICVFCDNDDCVLNCIGSRGETRNFCMPEITSCDDFRDYREGPDAGNCEIDAAS